MRKCVVRELGRMEYGAALDLQRQLVEARKAGGVPDQLLLVEHPHVITLGRNGHMDNLLAGERVLARAGIAFYPTDRGGDITYHGPGQIVGYPILDLNGIRRDVVWYVRQLEQCMIQATSSFGIEAFRVPGCTGVWVRSGDHFSPKEKLASIGVHISRWVTSHGFAYNVATDLRYFDLIVPCGIADRKATSLEKLLSRAVTLEEVKPRLTHHLAVLLSLDSRATSREELLTLLAHFENTVTAPS